MMKTRGEMFRTAEEIALGRADSESKSVLTALKSPRSNFRSLRGISLETGLDENVVERVLADHAALIRKSPCPGPGWEPLFALRSNSPRPSLREVAAAVRVYVTAELPVEDNNAL